MGLKRDGYNWATENNSPIDKQEKEKRELNSDEANDLNGHKDEGSCYVPGPKKID